MRDKTPETLARAYGLMGESIAKHREIIATLEDMRKAVIHELLRQSDDISLRKAPSITQPWEVVEHRVNGPNKRTRHRTQTEAYDHILALATK